MRGGGGVLAGRLGAVPVDHGFGPPRHGGLRAACVLGDQRHRRTGQVRVAVGRVGGGFHEGAEPGQQGRRRGPHPGAALQAGHDQAGQVRRHAGQVRVLGGQFHEHVHDRIALVGPVPGRGEQQGAAEGIDIAGRGGVLGVTGLLGRHVGGRADRAAGDGQLDALGRPRHTEVDDPGAVRRHQHVRRLQVTVHQAREVNGLQRLRASGGQPADRRHRQRAAGLHQVAERRGGHVGGRQPGDLGLGVGRHHGRGEHAADPAGGGDLPAETGTEAGLLGQLNLDRLDRHQPPRRGAAQVHLAHRSGTQAAE